MHRELLVNGERSGLRIRLADRWYQRALGLLATPHLEDPAGLWIQPCNAVRMLGMRSMHTAIDVLFVDAKGRVLKRVDNLQLWRTSACPGAHVALQLRAGLAAALDLHAGQHLALASDERSDHRR